MTDRFNKEERKNQTRDKINSYIIKLRAIEVELLSFHSVDEDITEKIHDAISTVIDNLREIEFIKDLKQGE